MMNEVIPKFYRYLRQRRQLSQTEFGVAIGRQRAAVSRWESGRGRPSYADERRLLREHGFSQEETLEVLSEALVEALGRPVTILFEERDLDHPEHPLSLAEKRLREGGGQLPEKLRNHLLRRILAARADVARTEHEHGYLLEEVETYIESYRKNGDPNASS